MQLFSFFSSLDTEVVKRNIAVYRRLYCLLLFTAYRQVFPGSTTTGIVNDVDDNEHHRRFNIYNSIVLPKVGVVWLYWLEMGFDQ